jgi:DNA-binding protein YbaB
MTEPDRAMSDVASDAAYAAAFIANMGATVPTKTMRDVHYEDVAAAALAAMEDFEQAAIRLAKVPVTGRSRDGRVVVQVNAAGELLAFHLRHGTLQWYDSATLGDVVTRTLRRAQEQARGRYRQEVDALVPREIVECQQVVQEALDRAALIDATATGS